MGMCLCGCRWINGGGSQWPAVPLCGAIARGVFEAGCGFCAAGGVLRVFFASIGIAFILPRGLGTGLSFYWFRHFPDVS